MHDSRRRFLGSTAGVLAARLLGRRSWASTRPVVTAIDGALVSTSDLKRQRELFEGVFGMQAVSDARLDAAAVEALWGVAGRTARSVQLETPGTGKGVRLVAFDPPSETAIRDGAAGIDADALKVLDFAVRDFDRAVAAVEQAGLQLAGPPVEYDAPPHGRFTEAHLHGPDSITCALIRFHDMDPASLVRAADRLFSEPLGISAPVSKVGPAVAFYERLGLDLVLRYDIESEAFQKLLGPGAKTTLVGRNFGLASRAPMLGVVHYGLPDGTFRSLRERAVLPHRGLAAVCLRVRSAAALAEVCRAAGDAVAAGPLEAELAPYGRVRSVCVRGPHGVVHHALEIPA